MGKAKCQKGFHWVWCRQACIDICMNMQSGRKFLEVAVQIEEVGILHHILMGLSLECNTLRCYVLLTRYLGK